MRLLWSLAKFILFLGVITFAAGAALFWLPTGSQVVKPLSEWAVNYFFNPLDLKIADMNGSIHDGYKIQGLRLLSADEELLKLDHFLISPDWDMVLNGLDGIPFIKIIEAGGISSDLDKVTRLANLFTPESSDKASNKNKDDSQALTSIKINPFTISIDNIFFSTPQINTDIQKLFLDEDGNLILKSRIISKDNILPLNINALLDFETLEIKSSDLQIGKGSGILKAKIMPSPDIKLFLTALQIDEFMKFSPEKLNASGRLDAKLFYNDSGASGVLSMPRGNIMDVPLKFRLPFNWNGADTFKITDADLKTNAASLHLDSSANINTMKITANGEAKNISLREIGKIFAPDIKLEGEGGYLKFDLDMIASGDILNNITCDLNSRIPFISVMNMKVLNNFTAKAVLKPNETPKIALNGEIFKGKLFARGEAAMNDKGEFKPQAVFSVVNLDLPTLVNTIPDLKKSVKKPSGKLTLRAVVAENLDIDAKLNSDKLSMNGVTITNTKADLRYSVQKNEAALENFITNLGKGIIKASGYADVNKSTFKFFANVNNLELKAIPDLKEISGVYNVDAQASGNYANLKTITASANLRARNIGYGGMSFGDVDVPVNFASNKLNIPSARAKLPGGDVTFGGNIDINNANNPNIAIALSSKGVDLAKVFKAFNLENKDMPIKGNVRGVVNVLGRLDSAKVFADLTANNIKAGEFVDMPTGKINIEGNMKEIFLKKLEAKINKADLKASGNLKLNQSDIMQSTFLVNANVKNFLLDPVLKKAIGSTPVTGMLSARVVADGSFEQPKLKLNLTNPITAGGIKIEDIEVRLATPEKNYYKINAGAKTGTFRINTDIDLKNKNNVWFYNVATKPMNLGNLTDSFAPDAKGMVSGQAVLKVDGSTNMKDPVNINLSSNKISLLEKINIEKLNVPVQYFLDKNQVSMKDARAVISEGQIRSGFELNVNTSEWKSNLRVRGLNFGKLAQPFLPEGELIGSADLDVHAKGNYSKVWPNSYANGKFRTSSGYFHKMKLLDDITPTKQISFENIKGSFFWNGSDLFFNPGTQATAAYSEPLYRYISMSGSCGLAGKNLNLVFEGRFDLKILDRFLGAMKGIFQYMAGNLARNVLRDAAGRVLGMKTRDFQNVSFRLANNWQELHMLDLTITKPIEDFLPVDILNRDQEVQKDDKQFKLSIKIPTGPGDKSIEEESTTDQFKEQLIDNLFNIGL